MKNKHLLILLIILSVSLSFRLIGLNWDQNQHLHPDERFLTMVAGALKWPNSFSQYLDTETSPLNPHNQKFDFYVYGTYPVILTKFIAYLINFDDYHHLVLVGRIISAILDTATVLLIYLVAKKLSSAPIALWSSFFYAISVLPIQLSHFFAVDTYLVFFITVNFFLFILFYTSFPSRKSYLYALLMGISYGLVLGAKVSGLIVLPVFALGYLILLISYKKILPIFLSGLIFISFSYLSLRISMPYLFSNSQLVTLSLNQKVLNNWKDLKYQSQPNHYLPPSTQWINVAKGWFPFVNLVSVGLGLPLAAFCVLGVFISPLLKPKRPLIYLTSFLVLSIFGYQSFQFAQPMRYFYPIYPFLSILGGILTGLLSTKFNWLKWILVPAFLVWPLSFISIYTRLHSRVSASVWIYENIPPGSTVSCDYWDDCLPLPIPELATHNYQTLELHLYDQDTTAKWLKLTSQLKSIDYLLLTSNRLYGSIMSDPDYYPITNRFYTSIFNGSLGFEKIAEFSSRPNIPFPNLKTCLPVLSTEYGIPVQPLQECNLSGISFVDDYVDETFTVYDHPKVLIFRNTRTGLPVNFSID